MSEIFQYQTIDKAVTDALLKIKGSKFYGLLFPIEKEKDVPEYLQKTREIYPKATHYCYAYRIGLKEDNYRANDDGEPSGTAGVPIYNQLLSANITNILLIVVRYFGGTKLGVGGLIKAYKESAQHTIAQTNIVTKELSEFHELVFDYDKQSSVMILLKKIEVEPTSFDFKEKCKLIIEIPLQKKTLFLEKFDSLFTQNLVLRNKII